MRDNQRSLVYEAEYELRTTLDRGGLINFFGSTLTVPTERKFGDVGSVGPYVEKVLAFPPVAALPRAQRPVTVRERKGAKKAHYEPATATIAIPPYRLDGWALREQVVLHELAHHLTEPGPAHGPEFTATLCYLLGVVIGEEAEFMFRVALGERGAVIGPSPALVA